MASRYYNNLVFKHMIDMPASQCVFCATSEKSTGRTFLYLIFEQKNTVYKRNGLSSTWHELKDDESSWVQQEFSNVVRERRIPCFRTRRAEFFNA